MNFGLLFAIRLTLKQYTVLCSRDLVGKWHCGCSVVRVFIRRVERRHKIASGIGTIISSLACGADSTSVWMLWAMHPSAGKGLVMLAERGSMNTRAVKVLLVGDGIRNALILQNHLQRQGCEIFFATSYGEATEMLKERQFDLVLSEFMLSDGTAYQLASALRGTRTTMFFSNAVEDDCWWMTAVFKGQDRSGEPGMRPREFRIRLDEVLYDTLFRSHVSASGSSRISSGNIHAEL